MKLRLLTLTFIVFCPFYALGYNSADYYPNFVPYNFDEVVEAVESDFTGCDDDLETYDRIYQEFDHRWVQGNYGGGDAAKTNYYTSDYELFGTKGIFTYNGLRDVAEEAFRLCLIDYREYIDDREKSEEEKEEKERDIEARAAARDCDFETIEEDLGSAERSRYSNEIDQCYAQVALDTCDMDEIDDFSSSIRMANYDRILECEDKGAGEIQEAQSIEPVNITNQPVYVSLPQPITYTSPQQQTSVPVTSLNINETTTADKPEIATTTEATTTPKEIAVTEEELNRIVQERVDEALAKEQEESKPKPEPEKPSIFKRVMSFLFGWL